MTPPPRTRLRPCPTRRRIAGWTPARQAAFVAALADGHPVRAAAAAVGLSARSAYLLRARADAADFARAWDAAVDAGAEALDQTALARALHGERQTVFYRGRPVGERVVHDTRLLLGLLDRRGGRRRRFAPRGKSVGTMKNAKLAAGGGAAAIPVSAAAAETVLAARDGDLTLRLDVVYDASNSPWGVAAYRFALLAGGARAGTISLRIGDDERLVRYAGHIGFGVDAAYRGRRLAGRAVRLLLPLAARHGVAPVWLGCNPDNAASMAVMAWLGATYVETVDLPSDYERYYARGERQKRRYRLDYEAGLRASAPTPKEIGVAPRRPARYARRR